MDVSLEVHAVQLDLCFHASDFNITEISMIFCVCDQLKGLAERSEMEKKGWRGRAEREKFRPTMTVKLFPTSG